MFWEGLKPSIKDKAGLKKDECKKFGELISAARYGEREVDLSPILSRVVKSQQVTADVTGRGRRSQSRIHTRQTYKAIWRTKRTSCVYCFSHHTSRLNQIRFKGGGVVSVSSFLIVNTLPHCKDVVLDIYNTAEIVVSVTILKILVCFTHSSFVQKRGDQALTYRDYTNNLKLFPTSVQYSDQSSRTLTNKFLSLWRNKK